MTVPYDERAASPRRDAPQEKDPYPRKPHDRDHHRYHHERPDHPRRDNQSRHYARGSDDRLSPQRRHPSATDPYHPDHDQRSPDRPNHRNRDGDPPRHPDGRPSPPSRPNDTQLAHPNPDHGQNGNRAPAVESDPESDRNDRRYEPHRPTEPRGPDGRADDHHHPPIASEPAPDSEQLHRSDSHGEHPNVAGPSENGNSADDARIESDKNAQGAHSAVQPDADGSSPALINLFVRNVARHVVEDQLVNLFSKFGKVDSAIVVRDPLSGECRGFGFVKVYSEDSAKAAIENLRDFEFEGRKISVERAKRNAPHQRTPGAYMGIDRRIRDRYAGIKRAREYDSGYGYGDPYMRRGAYRGRYGEASRPRYDDRGWDSRRDHRPPYGRSPYDERDRVRRRYDEGPRYPPRDLDRDQRFRERQPPVPRESADDYI
ncbi:transformer-SR ribonucleoprotein [Gracilaria domingensis]|nr:transformer-SR ribonucleoprotein [Gracilaria domingensis]